VVPGNATPEWFAVKKVSEKDEKLLLNEKGALARASRIPVPRVVQLYGVHMTGSGDYYLVQE